MRTQTFPKNEHLASKKAIDELFKSGKTYFSHPIKAVYLVDQSPQEAGNVIVMVVVPKRVFKSAVKRNLIRRRVKEAYRLNKLVLTELAKSSGCIMNIAFIYTHTEIELYSSIQNAVKILVKKLEKRMPENQNE